MVRNMGKVALAVALILLSAALGIVAANQLYEASRLLSAWLVPMGPMDGVGWQHLVVLLPRVLLIMLLFVWLGAVFLWMHYYVRRAHEPRRLWALFARVTLVELGLAGLAWLVRFGLPRIG